MFAVVRKSLPSRGAWIEIFVGQVIFVQEWSLPSRGAWIEIGPPGGGSAADPVAPLTGSVD